MVVTTVPPGGTPGRITALRADAAPCRSPVPSAATKRSRKLTVGRGCVSSIVQAGRLDWEDRAEGCGATTSNGQLGP